jgi:hypothetical protein
MSRSWAIAVHGEIVAENARGVQVALSPGRYLLVEAGLTRYAIQRGGTELAMLSFAQVRHYRRCGRLIFFDTWA